jgi:hypothetical protein
MAVHENSAMRMESGEGAAKRQTPIRPVRVVFWTSIGTKLRSLDEARAVTI